ncbi:MAG: dUTP diphosphatase [Hyphomonas sp.]|nr:dUTP diphosphatase [Hyphomonas sp.]
MFTFTVNDPRVVDAETGRVQQFLRGSEVAAGFDLVAWPEEPIILHAGAPAELIPLGVSLFIENPTVFGAIYPRSGLGHKKGLVCGNGTGIIDADYQGPLSVSAFNRNNPSRFEPIKINPGDRIAQIVFQTFVTPELLRVDSFENSTERATGGFGSTGV